jgi:N-acylneuraminate cytidylyltransferase
MSKSIAIIPARGGSKRIPRKNIRDFLGSPIISYPIKAALDSGCFDEVMVSTDDEEIAAVAKKYGAKVPFFRSEENSSDYANTVSVILEVLDQYRDLGQEFDMGCCIYPTAVFASVDLIGKAKETLLESSELQSVFPVLRFSYPVQRGLKSDNGIVQMVWPEHLNARSQDLEPMYHDSGQFYWYRTADLLEQKRLFMDKSFGIEIPETEAQDMDNFLDWEIAEIKYSRLK